LHSGAGLGLGGAGPRPVEVVDGGDGAVIVAALPSSSSSSPSPSSSPSVVTRPTASAPGFEFPDDTTTWRAFLDKVRAVRAGARAKARVVQLGDSEIAGDRFVSTLRNDMAAQIGLGGPGFALASPPWHWYRRAGFESLDSSGFRGHSFVFARGNEGNFGPGGVAFDAVAADARVDAKLEARFAGAGCTIEFFFAAQPGGGAIELFVDDASTGVVELAGDAAVSSWRHTATSCPRRLSARVRRLPARVFGWSIESAQNGVVWTSLGTVGANASALSRYGPGRLGQALSLLQPDLVVASYGLNLTGHGAPVPRSEGEQLQRLMAEIRAVRPDTACLVMSPYPVLVDTDGALAPSGTTRRLANVQRKAAQAAGCVFLDRERLVGGPDVALQWLNRKPRYLSGDYVHLTPEGASYVSRTVSRLLIGEIFGG
jgi:lysophospholipase L1-like esterase